MLRKKSGFFVAIFVVCFFTASMSPGRSLAGALEDAVDNPVQRNGTTPLAFTPGGDLQWASESSNTHDGIDAAQSGAITHSQSSWMETTVTGPASISFYQKVSSQTGYDLLKVTIDGVQKSAISGTVDWQQKTFVLPTAAHDYTLRWTYSKNASVSSGTDAAWLDQVVVSPNTALTVTSPNGGEKWAAGSSQNITWNAPAAAEKYDLYYTTNNGTSWSLITSNLTSANLTNISHTWTVPVPNGNKTACKIKVVAKNAANAIVGTDISNAPFTIQVLRVDSPNGGDILSSHVNPNDIRFTIIGQTNAQRAILSYTMDGGVTWKPITTMVGGLGTPQQYTYSSWMVPSVPVQKTLCKVKVVITDFYGVVLGTDTSDANFTIRPTFSISGAATLNGKALSGVTVTLDGAYSATARTDAYGKYIFKDLWNGNYTVTAGKTGHVFSPAIKAIAVTTAKIANVNFTATGSSGSTHSISGAVIGTVVSGVTMTLSGTVSGTVPTDGSGNYTFTNVPDGVYTVTPGKAASTFSPLSSAVTVSGSDVSIINFASTASTGPTYSISGKATYGGMGLPGVEIMFAGSPAPGSVVTDAGGNYTIKGLKNGGCVLNPSKTGYTFVPANVIKIVAGLNIAGVNFTATGSSHGISGHVFSIDGVTGVPGVTITLNTSPARTAVTDGSGLYTISNVPDGTYTLTPSISTASAAFAPANKIVTVSGIDVSQDFKAIVTYSISGTVSYSGTKTGRVYINVYRATGEDVARGTSIAAPGAFTIRGIEPGTNYILKAFRDTMGTGVRNASNPVGQSSAFDVVTSHVTGKNITLANPSSLVADAPENVIAIPGDNEAVAVMWDAPRDGNGVETAKYYRVYWHTDGTISKTNYTEYRTLVASDNPIFFHSGTGVTNGNTLSYIVTSISENGTESAESAPVSVDVYTPPPAGTYAVSGSISVPSLTMAPLYVGVYSDRGGLHFTRVSPGVTAYDIMGVPDGVYQPFAFIDMNNNGVMDIGDILNADALSGPITVNDANANRDLVLTGAGSHTLVATNHIQVNGVPDDTYQLSTGALRGKNQPVKVSILSGPNIPAPIDVGNPRGQFVAGFDIGTTRPEVGDAYTLSVTYQNNVTETLIATVTGVLNTFARNLAASADLTPTFTWDDPLPPPTTPYTYILGILSNSGGTMWYYPGDEGMPSSQHSVVYNADGKAIPPVLSAATTYYLAIVVKDSDRNSASNIVSFTTP